MDEKNVASAPEQSEDRDQALFASIRREKQRKKRRRIGGVLLLQLRRKPGQDFLAQLRP